MGMVDGRPSADLKSESGAVTVEFTLIASLLMLLTLAAMQFALALHVRNILIDAASTGARFGALADRDPADGAARATELVESSVSSALVTDIYHQQLSTTDGDVVQVTITAEVPILSALPGIDGWEVTGTAYVVE